MNKSLRSSMSDYENEITHNAKVHPRVKILLLGLCMFVMHNTVVF